MAGRETSCLCLTRKKAHFEIFVGGYEVVGEVDEFIEYDEDGNEIEEFDYDDLPRIINGVNVVDVEDGFLISDRLIQNGFIDAIVFSSDEKGFEHAIQEWLKLNKWPEDNFEKIVSLIKK